MKKVDLSIIIVSYNGREYLRGTIQSVLANAPKSLLYEIIVVDNDSTDGSALWSKKISRMYY